MSEELDREQLDRYWQYVESVERTLAVGGTALHPLDLGSIRLSLATVGEILDQDLVVTGRFLGTTTVDQIAKIA